MNLVPLIDVLLVIIIFLVVSTTFARMSELQINLPTAQANSPADALIEMQKFLTAIVLRGGSASRKHLPVADRAQDKARTKAKRLGWVEFRDGAWHITDKGRAAHQPQLSK